MNIFASSQDLFANTVRKLYVDPEFKCNPRNLFIHEDLGFSARIENPSDRLISIPERHWDIVYGLGEFIWYVTGSNSLDFINYYAPSYTRFSDDGETLYGAYGTRLFKSTIYKYSANLLPESGIRSIIRKLRQDPDSRQALSVIWREDDMHLLKTKDLPCTVALQFFIRDNKLCMITTMRSNDVWLGATNDIFCFTMMQELIASELGIEMGFYQHNAGSMHMYENDILKITNNKEFFKEHSSYPMDKTNNFYEQIRHLIRYEKVLRESEKEVYYKAVFNKKENKSFSRQIRNLMLVLYYGKIRKTRKAEDKKLFDNLYQNIVIEEITDSAIINCIQTYEKGA